MSEHTTVRKSDLQPWLRNRPYLWPIMGAVGLILTTPWWLNSVVWPAVAKLTWEWKFSMKESWALMMGRVEE